MKTDKQFDLARSGVRVVTVAGLLALSAPALSSGSGMHGARVSGADTPQAETDAAEQLALRIRAEIAALPENATLEEREAAIVFVVSQNDIPIDTAIAALTLVEGVPGIPPTSRKAVTNVKLALLRRKIGRGTAALGSGNGFGSSSFSGPVVGGGGGGGSDYTE